MMKKEKEPDPFALEVGNNEMIEAIHRLEFEGKKIHRMEVVEHGYVLRFYIPNARASLEHLIELILDFGCGDDRYIGNEETNERV